MFQKTQFCVGIDNKPGMLAKLCHDLRSVDVNIEALCISEDTDCVWVNIVATPADRATVALEGKGYRFLTENVLTLEVANKPGELERIATTLAEASVNISYIYGAGASGAACELVLSVDDATRACEVLGADPLERTESV